MNRLGKMIQKHIEPDDTVLDLGCGIMQATTDIVGVKENLKCKLIVGVELVSKYLDRIKDKYPTINTDVRNTNLFVDDSYDVVICTDVLEHLKLDDAIDLLKEMKRIARKKVVIYTPLLMESNEENVHDGWGMGENELQRHQCVVPHDALQDLGYEIALADIDGGNTFGVYTKDNKYQSDILPKNTTTSDLFGSHAGGSKIRGLARKLKRKVSSKSKENERSLKVAHKLWDDIGNKSLEETMEGICDGWDKKTFDNSDEFLMTEVNIQFKQSDKVLDLACGIGRACKWVAPKVKSYTGVDFSEGMIKKAKEYNKKFNNVTFTKNDGVTLPIEDDYFDTVFCELAYQHMIKDTQIKNTDEVFRVLKKGGKYYVQLPKLDFYKDDTYCWNESELAEHFKSYSTWKILETSYKFRAYFTVEAIK